MWVFNPFARQTAEQIVYPHKYIPNFSNTDMTFWTGVVRFENRYYLNYETITSKTIIMKMLPHSTSKTICSLPVSPFSPAPSIVIRNFPFSSEV
jgi:hypothetical protein